MFMLGLQRYKLPQSLQRLVCSVVFWVHKGDIYISPMTNITFFWVHTQRKQNQQDKDIIECPCLLQHFQQQLICIIRLGRFPSTNRKIKSTEYKFNGEWGSQKEESRTQQTIVEDIMVNETNRVQIGTYGLFTLKHGISYQQWIDWTVPLKYPFYLFSDWLPIPGLFSWQPWNTQSGDYTGCLRLYL